MTISNQPAGQKEKAAARKDRVLDLRIQGFSYRQIGREVDCSRSTVAKDLNKALTELAERRSEKTETLRQLELERIDIALNKMYSHLGRTVGVDRWVKLIDLRAKLLGLYAPQRFDHGDVHPVALIEVRLANTETSSERAEPENDA